MDGKIEHGTVNPPTALLEISGRIHVAQSLGAKLSSLAQDFLFPFSFLIHPLIILTYRQFALVPCWR